MRESLPELTPYMAWATSDYALAVCEANIRAAIAQFAAREGLRYHFFDRTSGELVAMPRFTTSTGRCRSSSSATGAARAAWARG